MCIRNLLVINKDEVTLEVSCTSMYEFTALESSKNALQCTQDPLSLEGRGYASITKGKKGERALRCISVNSKGEGLVLPPLLHGSFHFGSITNVNVSNTRIHFGYSDPLIAVIFTEKKYKVS